MTLSLKSMPSRLLLAGAVLTLSSCGLLIEGIVITVQRACEVPVGKVLSGDGFTLRCPEECLHASRNIPTTGGVTLRPDWSSLEMEEAYFVTPFRTTTARTPEEALAEWNRRTPQLRQAPPAVLRQHRTTFAGLPATRSIMHFPAGSRGQYVAMLVVRRSTDFLILASGGPYQIQENKANTLARHEAQLDTLQLNTSITRK